MNFVFLGLSITSSWGNGHATTYRALIKALAERGHHILFLERDVPYYAANRDLPDPQFCELELYHSLEELQQNHADSIAKADVVIVGSYVPQAVEVGNWVCSKATGLRAFYDIDTPVTLAKLERGDHQYIDPDLIARYDLYLSFSGGPVLDILHNKYHSPAAKPLYCSVDPELYFPEEVHKKWSMGYLGTYSDDRQPVLEELLGQTAFKYPGGKFVVAGPQYPKDIIWASSVERIEHLAPSGHRNFYNAQLFTLNITRQDMKNAGYSPSVRLFEAAACGIPTISDNWQGIDSFFISGKEILIADTSLDVLNYLQNITEEEAMEIGENARQKVLQYHTSKHRAVELEDYIGELRQVQASAKYEKVK